MSIQDLIEEQNRHIDAIVAAFEHHLSEIVTRATARVQGILQARLNLTDGVIDQTPGNTRLLRTIDNLFAKEMKSLGFDGLLEAFVSQFSGQVQYFNEILRMISGELKTPLPEVTFSAADRSLFASQQLNAQDAITAAVTAAAETAKRQALFGVGGLKFADLIETMAVKFAVSVANAKTLADTALSTYYRTVADRGFQVIERDLPANALRYSYMGPLDERNRPFCRHLEERSRDGKIWTRAQIDKMDNEQLPNVFVTAGGFNCRHQWALALIQPKLDRKAA